MVRKQSSNPFAPIAAALNGWASTSSDQAQKKVARARLLANALTGRKRAAAFSVIAQVEIELPKYYSDLAR